MSYFYFLLVSSIDKNLLNISRLIDFPQRLGMVRSITVMSCSIIYLINKLLSTKWEPFLYVVIKPPPRQMLFYFFILFTYVENLLDDKKVNLTLFCFPNWPWSPEVKYLTQLKWSILFFWVVFICLGKRCFNFEP